MKTFIAASALIASACVLANPALARNESNGPTRVTPDNSVIEHDKSGRCGHNLSTDPDERIRFHIRRDCLHHKH
jgi:hypothetical protein